VKRPLSRIYLVTILILMVIGPIASILIEFQVAEPSPAIWDLTGKWFVFWACGLRMLLAGIRQTTRPAFTAQTIFGLTDSGSDPIVRELGFGNLAQGLLGVASLFLPQWRVASAVVSGLYYGLAGAAHIARKPDGPNEIVALVTDVWIFVILAGYTIHAANSSFR
jgi:hypothetical protein